VTAELIAAGVVVDFRRPDVIRIGCSPLTTSFADVHAGLDCLRGLLGG
jgi:kynureninase